MGLFHDEPPLKCGGLHGHRGVHHEILCAVIQEERSDWQALTAATLHNAPLRIIEQMCCSTFPLRTTLAPGRLARIRPRGSEARAELPHAGGINGTARFGTDLRCSNRSLGDHTP